MNKIITIVPHYNNPDGLYSSLNSIHKNERVDILIVDDGSRLKKPDEEKAANAFKADGKIIFIYLAENKGIEQALNTGLRWAIENSYPFIARLDCGDKNIGERFNKQLKFLEENQKIFLAGTWAKVIDQDGNHIYDLCYPTESQKLKKRIYIQNPFVHPSIMFRSEALKKVGFYPVKYPAAEDYAFFFKFVNNYDTANLGETLIEYEINTNSISSKRRKDQVESRVKLLLDNFKFGIYPAFGILRNFFLIYATREQVDSIKRLIKWKAE